jgi:hypothetical protein
LVLRNIPSLADLANDPGLVHGLPMDVVRVLLKDADDLRRVAEGAKKALVGYVLRSYAGDIADAFTEAEKDYGAVRIEAEGFEVEVTREKKVSWDSDGLGELCTDIARGGENPHDYVKIERKVEERKYASWPPAIRERFDAYRTTTPGSETVKFTA